MRILKFNSIPSNPYITNTETLLFSKQSMPEADDKCTFLLCLPCPCLACPAPVLPKCSTILPRDLLQWEVAASIFILTLSTAQTFLIYIPSIIDTYFVHAAESDDKCKFLWHYSSSRHTNMFSERHASTYLIPSIIHTFVHTAQAVDKCAFLLCLSCPLLLKCSVRDGCPTSSKTQQCQVRFWLKV